MNKIKIHTLLSGILFSISSLLWGQNAGRFQGEVDALNQLERHFSPDDRICLFTGSSSIRMWKDVQAYFPEKKVVNTGFGGSTMSDLLYYADDLILKYKPAQVFIYEGDNDIAGKIRAGRIMKTTRELIEKIRGQLPEADIVLISPKPSLARWSMQKKYLRLNRKMARYAGHEPNMAFASVWNIMLDETGAPRKDIFLEDGLHMNKTGYDLWAGVIGGFIK